MRVAIIYCGEKQKELLRDLSQALARGIQSQNVMVDVFNSQDISSSLMIYQYIVLGTEAAGNFGGKIPEKINQFLKSAGRVSGIRSMAFLSGKGLRKEKSLLVLMKRMESEGMIVSYSDILLNTQSAEALGKTLDIQPRH